MAAFLLLPGSPARADHVSVALHVSARLGERNSDNSWSVIVDWSIDCTGAAPGTANYYGSLNLGSETVEVTGNVVSVPAKGDEDGDGVVDPAPPAGATPPPVKRPRR